MQKVDAWGTKGQEGNGSSSGWTFRWAGGVVVAVAAMVGVLVSAACTDERGAPSPSAVARDRPLTGGVLSSVAGVPGTPLGDGIELAEGTVLIGDPIQTRQSRGDGAGREVVAVTGWEATSLIDGGDPVAIIEDYLAQARALGLTDQADRGCVLDGDVTFCSAEAAAPEGEPRSISISMLRGRRGDVLSNHVLVHYATGGLRASPSKGKRYGSAPVPVAPDPSDWPPLATVGEPIGTAMELNRALVVEAGSRLAGPPLLTSRDATGGIEAILEVTGPPRAVLRAYVEQLGTDTLDAHGVGDRVRIGDITHTGGTAAVSGGDYYQFTLIEQEGRPTLLHVLGGKD